MGPICMTDAFFLLSMSTKRTAGEDLFLVTSAAGDTLIPKGRHHVVIESITRVNVMAKDAEWKDPTPMLNVKVRNKDGLVLTIQQSTQAYVRYSELEDDQLEDHKAVGDAGNGEQYALNLKTGSRVKCGPKDKHQIDAIGFFNKMAHATGVEADEQVNFFTLVGKSMGINVTEKENGFREAKQFFRIGNEKPATSRKASRK